MLDLPVALLVMSVIGIVAFAASGALVGARAGMDWLGVSTLAAVTAIGGGTLRDLLMARVPGWLTDFWITVGLIAVTVIVVWISVRAFPWQRHRRWMGRLFTLSDAVGLAAFTVTGTDLARRAGFGVGPAVVLGVLSGIGGGVLRDVLAGRRVQIFTGEVYALAAAAGSIAFLAVGSFAFPWVASLVGLALVLLVRLGAVAMGWRVPTLPGESESPELETGEHR
jgi:uncharacterized membrane protein YeiH